MRSIDTLLGKVEDHNKRKVRKTIKHATNHAERTTIFHQLTTPVIKGV